MTGSQQLLISTSSSPQIGGTTTGGGTFNSGATCTVTAATNSGYSFNKWTENGIQVSTSPNYQFSVANNRNLLANFSQNSASIRVISPNGGENLSGGSNYNIQVTTSSEITSLDFYYSENNGINWHYISSLNATPTVTTYSWLVNYVQTQSALVKVVGHGSSGLVTDISDNNFTINVGCISTLNYFPYGNTPGFDCNGNTTFQIDYWNFWKFTCTSWVAWKINEEFGYTNVGGPYIFTNNKVFNKSTRLGNASEWGIVLTRSPFFFIADNTPTVGSIAWYASGAPGATGGHVAFVNCVNGNEVTLTEYNGGALNQSNPTKCIYGTRIIHMDRPNISGNRIPTKFIHIEVGGGGSGSTPNNTQMLEFSLYPNPSDGNVSIAFAGPLADPAQLKIYDNIGQLVMTRSLAANTRDVFLDVSMRSNGLYFVQIISAASQKIKKLIIKR